MAKPLDLVGQKFNRLLVIERVEDKIDANSGKHKSRFKCLCDCGNYTIQLGTNIKSGRVKSCGCYHKEVSSKIFSESTHRKKYNTYDLTGEYGIGYTLKEEPFYFDLENYDKIKDICWYMNSRGYLVGYNSDNSKTIKMHRYIMGLTENDSQVIDHINSTRKMDNRKCNLRITSQAKNTINRQTSKTNTSGITGVSFNRRKQKWVAYITYNKKRKHLGYFSSKEEAIIARKEAENKYFKEFSKDNSLKLYNNQENEI